MNRKSQFCTEKPPSWSVPSWPKTIPVWGTPYLRTPRTGGKKHTLSGARLSATVNKTRAVQLQHNPATNGVTWEENLRVSAIPARRQLLLTPRYLRKRDDDGAAPWSPSHIPQLLSVLLIQTHPLLLVTFRPQKQQFFRDFWYNSFPIQLCNLMHLKVSTNVQITPRRHAATPRTPVRRGLLYRQSRAEHYSAITSGQRGTGRSPPPNHAPARTEAASTVPSPPPSPPSSAQDRRAAGTLREVLGSARGAAAGAAGGARPATAASGKSGEVWRPPPGSSPRRDSPAWTGRAAGTPPWRRPAAGPAAAPPTPARRPRCLRAVSALPAAEWSAAPPTAPPRTAPPAAGGDVRPCRKGRCGAPRRGAEPRGGASPRREGWGWQRRVSAGVSAGVSAARGPRGSRDAAAVGSCGRSTERGALKPTWGSRSNRRNWWPPRVHRQRCLVVHCTDGKAQQREAWGHRGPLAGGHQLWREPSLGCGDPARSFRPGTLPDGSARSHTCDTFNNSRRSLLEQQRPLRGDTSRARVLSGAPGPQGRSRGGGGADGLMLGRVRSFPSALAPLVFTRVFPLLTINN